MCEQYPNKPWNWGEWGLSDNPNLTIEMIEKYPDKPWDWNSFLSSLNDKLTFDIINKYPDKDWDWNKLSYHEDLSCDFVDWGD